MVSSQEVAARSGVSRSTVSQILNGHENRFAHETVTRVREIADLLGYKPSAAARTLVRGTSDIVLTVIPNITFGPRLRELVDVLTREIEAHGYTNLIRLETQAQALGSAILELRPRALISLTPLSAGERERLERHGVLVLEQSQALQEHLDVTIGRIQASHLAKRGYKTLAAAIPLDVREHQFAPPRASGATQWGLLNGLRVLPTLSVDLVRGGAVEAIRSLPDTRIGIAAYNDEVALALMGAAQSLGRRIPTDLGVIGVDNSPIAHIATPSITTIDFDLEFSARQMVAAIVGRQSLLALQQSEQLHEVEKRIVVIEGDSTA